MILHRYDLAIPLEAVIAETRSAVRGWDWSRGAYGHALSLPAYRDVHPSGRYSYQNFPCTALLARAPALRAIFAALQCEKVSFRLLRRAPGSAYAWHTDQWKGPGVVRFQIPILSDPAAYLVTTDYESPARVARPELLAQDFAGFAEANAGHVLKHHLEPGLLYYFDTTRAHTLVNPGPHERITLSFDLVANDWLVERFPAVRAELAGAAAATLPRPGRLGMSLAFLRSRLYPLRNRARAWLPRRNGAAAS